MKLIKAAIFLILFAFAAAVSKPVFVTTGHPVYAILMEIAGQSAKIIRLVPPGSSPHTFSPKPSDLVRIKNAKALFYISDALDGWAAKLPVSKKIALIDLLPKEYLLYFEDGHSHEGHEHHDNLYDPHFWTDPLAVKALVKPLLKIIKSMDPDNAKIYRKNARKFEKQLDKLNERVKKITASIKGEPVVLFHPSFSYFLKRYGLKLTGVVEADPGVEPSARHTVNLVEKIKSDGVKAVFSEPQLPKRPAEVIANSSGVKLYLIDPVGGIEGRLSYKELILFNAYVFKKALK